MFLNKTKVKQLIKSYFRWEELTVGRIYDGLVVAGGRWITWTEDGYIPNWIKAAVMEYTGELPKQGCVFKAKKDEPIQYEIAENSLYDLPEMKRKCRYAYIVTPVVIKDQHSQVRLLQQNTSGSILAVPETCCEIIDLSELVLGTKKLRTSDDQFVAAASMGLGALDIMIAYQLYLNATEMGIGTKVNLWDKPLWE